MFLCCLVLWISSCSYHVISHDPKYSYLNLGSIVQLQVNLHYGRNRKIYDTNYQQQLFLPRCTPVKIVKIFNKGLTFQIESGRKFHWILERHIEGDRVEHASQFFVQECDPLEGLSDIDQKGIFYGRPFEGMTKKGVLYAMGPPPNHRTPSLDWDEWIYWRNRYDMMVVRFENDIVVEIKALSRRDLY